MSYDVDILRALGAETRLDRLVLSHGSAAHTQRVRWYALDGDAGNLDVLVPRSDTIVDAYELLVDAGAPRSVMGARCKSIAGEALLRFSGQAKDFLLSDCDSESIGTTSYWGVVPPSQVIASVAGVQRVAGVASGSLNFSNLGTAAQTVSFTNSGGSAWAQWVVATTWATCSIRIEIIEAGASYSDYKHYFVTNNENPAKRGWDTAPTIASGYKFGIFVPAGAAVRLTIQTTGGATWTAGAGQSATGNWYSDMPPDNFTYHANGIFERDGRYPTMGNREFFSTSQGFIAGKGGFGGGKYVKRSALSTYIPAGTATNTQISTNYGGFGGIYVVGNAASSVDVTLKDNKVNSSSTGNTVAVLRSGQFKADVEENEFSQGLVVVGNASNPALLVNWG